MTLRLVTLENGLRLLLADMPEAQSVTVSAIVKVGSRYEDFESNGGVSHFLEHVLFKGTEQRPRPEQISQEIDAVGGWNNAYTSNDLTNFYIKVPKQHAALALDILSDMMQHSLFDPRDVDRERSVIAEEISMIRDTPEQYVGEFLSPLIWPRDALRYPVIGKPEVIQKISPAKIKQYQERHYTASNMVVVVAGSLNEEAIIEQVARQFSELRPGRPSHTDEVDSHDPKDITSSLAYQTNQAHFLVGARAYGLEHEDRPAASVVATILGQGMSSRLFVNVRERQGLAYNVSAENDAYVGTGLFEAYAGVNPEKAPQAIMAVLEELERIRQEPVERAELIKAKNQLRGSLQMSLENNAKVAEHFGSLLLLTGRLISFEELLEEIDGVTVEDVGRVARRLLAPRRLRLAIIAPDPQPAETVFKEQVEKMHGAHASHS